MSLLGVGHALVDIFAFVDEDTPKAMGLHPGTFNRVPDYRMNAILAALSQPPVFVGGSAANVVKLAARLGMSTAFHGQCGHDDAGQLFESELQSDGVSVRLSRADAATGRCVTFVAADGSQTVATARMGSGSLPSDLITDSVVAGWDQVLVEGYLLDEPEFFRILVERCQKQGKPVLLDVSGGDLASKHADTLAEYVRLGLIHLLAIREADSSALWGGTTPPPSDTFVQVVVRNLGGWRLEQGTVGVDIPALTTPALESSALNDAFLSGFLWGLEQGWSLGQAGRAGSLVAACVGERPGTAIDQDRWARLTTDLQNLSKTSSA